MKIRTNVKAGGGLVNHNEQLVRAAASGLKVKTHVKAGRMGRNPCPCG